MLEEGTGVKLRKVKYQSKILVNFYRVAIESILNGNIKNCHCSCMGQQTEEQFLPTCSEMHNPSKSAKETQRQLKNLQNVDFKVLSWAAIAQEIDQVVHEGCRFKSPQLHVEVYLSRILNPKLSIYHTI